MKLRGVPVDLRVGPVELRPFGKKCALLQPCIQCKLYPRVYFLCQASHVTCTECFLSDDDDNDAPQREGFCSKCYNTVTLFRFEIALQLLQTLKFVCGCNYSGRLCDIKKHVNSSKYSSKCCAPVAQPPRQTAKLDKEIAKLQEDYMSIVNECEEDLNQIRTLFRLKFVEPIAEFDDPYVYTVKKAERTKLELGLLNVRFNEIWRDLIKLQELSSHMTPVIEACFEETFVCIPFLNAKKTKDEYLIVASAIPFLIYFRWDSQRFATLSMKISPSHCQNSIPWPIRKKVVLRLHDRKGFIVKELILKTFTGQSYLHGTFKDPTQYPSFYEIPRFFDATEHGNRPEHLKRDILLTVQVWPLDWKPKVSS